MQVAEAEDFYFFAYLRWMKFHPLGPDALASLPQKNVWDDHDIFDGWGAPRRADRRGPLSRPLVVGRAPRRVLVHPASSDAPLLIASACSPGDMPAAVPLAAVPVMLPRFP
jgi:hypothetical protein